MKQSEIFFIGDMIKVNMDNKEQWAICCPSDIAGTYPCNGCPFFLPCGNSFSCPLPEGIVFHRT